MARELGNTVFYTTQEVASVLNSSIETVRGRIKEGIIKADKVNHGYLVSHSDLVDHLEEHEALPESIIDLRLNKKPVKSS